MDLSVFYHQEDPITPRTRSDTELQVSKLHHRQRDFSRRRAGKNLECITDKQKQDLEASSRTQLVQGSVVQLLVLGRSCGEDGRHRQQGGGSGWVPHLVDHDGGQGGAHDLQGRRGVIKGPLAQTGSAQTMHFLPVEITFSFLAQNFMFGRSYRQDGQGEDHADHDVHGQQDVVDDDGEAGLQQEVM